MNEVECRDLAFKLAADYVKEKGIRSGMTGAQQAAILARWGKETAEWPRAAAIAGFVELGNASGLRARLEKAGHLVTSNKKMAEDYENIA